MIPKMNAKFNNIQYLYGFTIHGIQKYIFNTNKLREIIWGSEIIEYICTDMFKEQECPAYNEDNLLQSAAGSISYIFDKKEDAQKFFAKFPTRVAEVAGNISFSQAIIEFDGKLTKEHRQLMSKKLREDRNKSSYMGECGFMAVPIYHRTGESAYTPFHKVINEENVDYTTVCKTDFEESILKGKSILLSKIEKEENIDFPKELSEITDKKSKNYLAIMHADGNSLGKVIQKIVGQTNSAENIEGHPVNAKENAEKLKEFSKTLETATRQAFNQAFNKFIVPNSIYGKSKLIYPLRPVILGGDDVTAIVRADLAIDFTCEYLKAFEKTTGAFLKNLSIPGVEKLTATAGIVFIKEKFPFHYAAHLAESICSTAKKESNREYSGLKFYRVQDSFVENYKNIIDKELTIKIGKDELGKDEILSFNKTYRIKDIEELQGKLKLLKNKEIPVRPLRKLLSLIYEDPTTARFHLNRARSVTPKIKKILKEQLKDNSHLYDLIALDSLTTDN